MKSISLKKIRIKNFRCFEDVTFSFGDEKSVSPNMIIIVGENGTGKTALLDSIAIVLDSIIHDNYGGKRSKDSTLNGDKDIRYYFDNGGYKDTTDEVFIEPTVASRSEQNTDPGSNWKITLRKSILQKIYSGKRDNTLKKWNKSTKTDAIRPVFMYQRAGRLWQKERGPIFSAKQSGYEFCLDNFDRLEMLIQWFRMAGKDSQALKVVHGAIHKLLNNFLEDNYGFNLSFDSDAQDILLRYSYYANSNNHVDSVLEEPHTHIDRLSCLGDGYRSIICMVAEIAIRMVLLNPNIEKVLESTPGIVLVDEIDLHLHPRWQQSILLILHDLFPKIQFFLTTHAPCILSSVDPELGEMLDMSAIGRKQYKSKPIDGRGETVNEILRHIMKVNKRDSNTQKHFDNFDYYIRQGEFNKAQNELNSACRINNHSEELAQCQLILNLEEYFRGSSK